MNDKSILNGHDDATNTSLSTTKTPVHDPKTSTADLLDLENLALSQDFARASGVKKLLTTVPVRKPNRHEFVRVHPGTDFTLSALALFIKEERDEIFLVPRGLGEELSAEVRPVSLFTTINRQGVVTLWPVKLPGSDGRQDQWNASALAAAAQAKTHWTRVAANMSLGAYEISIAAKDLAPPVWPDNPFQELLGIAFRGRIIDSIDHVVLQRLRGEI